MRPTENKNSFKISLSKFINHSAWFALVFTGENENHLSVNMCLNCFNSS